MSEPRSTREIPGVHLLIGDDTLAARIASMLSAPESGDWHVERHASADPSGPPPDAWIADTAGARHLAAVSADSPILVITPGTAPPGAWLDVLEPSSLSPVLLDRVLRHGLRWFALRIELGAANEHDALTGLPGQRLFHHHLEQALRLASRHERQAAVIALALDGLPLAPPDPLTASARERSDPTAAALAAREVAQRLRAVLRSSDLVARAGANRFLILLEGRLDHSDLSATAQKLLACVGRPIESADVTLHLAASIGLAVYPDSGRTAERLIHNAEGALAEVAAAGGNDFRLWETRTLQVSRRRIQMERELPGAIERDEFELYFQPQYSTVDRQIVGAEALLRWHGNPLGRIAPDDFMPVAERSGAMDRIGDWVLEQACRQQAEWVRAHWLPLRMAINVSGPQLRDGRILDTVERVIATTGVDPQDIELELTERVFVENTESHRHVFQRLRELGIHVAIDDFGVGYSSLHYLKAFPVSALKIDASFVRSLPNDSDDAAIVRAIIAMGHSLDMRVVAEGIENDAQLAFLRDQGCDEVQGYRLGRPMAAREFLGMVRRTRGITPDGATG